MFSQWNDRISSLEDNVAMLHSSILELKEENTRLKDQIAQMHTYPVREDKVVKEEPPVEVFMSVLKRVPNRPLWGRGDDELRKFFTENANSEKYYYMPVGDVFQDRHRNTLVPLGTFLGFLNYRGQVPTSDDQYYNSDNYSYFMRFSNYPYNSTENCNGPIGMDINPLVYTEEPPSPESIPLHYYDYIQLTTPEWFDEDGKPKQDYPFPLAFGDGVTCPGVQINPYRETDQLRQSRHGAANFIAKKTILHI